MRSSVENDSIDDRSLSLTKELEVIESHMLTDHFVRDILKADMKKAKLQKRKTLTPVSKVSKEITMKQLIDGSLPSDDLNNLSYQSPSDRLTTSLLKIQRQSNPLSRTKYILPQTKSTIQIPGVLLTDRERASKQLRPHSQVIQFGIVSK